MRKLIEIDQSIQCHNAAWRQLARDFRDIRDGHFAEMESLGPELKKFYGRDAPARLLGYSSLGKYWKERWGLTEREVNRMIQSLEIAEQVDPK